jgi:superfamily I DNA/RNA helicase
VYVIHAADGNIPSDMATGSTEEVEEELRLFYVALTRAKDWLYVCFPQRYYHAFRGRPPSGPAESKCTLRPSIPTVQDFVTIGAPRKH